MAKMGRKTKYKKIYSGKRLEEYLDSCTDGEKQTIVQENEEKGYRMYKTTLEVKLPTIEGYALFLNVARSSLYEWAEKEEEFKNALELIKTIQKQKLLEKTLQGDYNSTIAKLILANNHGMKDKADLTSGGKPLPLLDYAKTAGDNNSDK